MNSQRLAGIVGFHLVTADLDRLTRFYRDVLGFAAAGSVEPIGGEEMVLLGVPGAGRRQRLKIGEQRRCQVGRSGRAMAACRA